MFYLVSYKTQKGYIVYSLSQQKILVSRDVIFKEEVYLFATQKEKQHVTLYPTNSLLDTSDCDYEKFSKVLPANSSTSYEQEDTSCTRGHYTT